MRVREELEEKIFDAGPLAITVLTVVLVAGLGLGAFAFAGRDSHPSVGAAQISADGTTCIVVLVNHGDTDLHLDSVILSGGGVSSAVSFSSGFTLPRNSSTAYPCALGTTTQFVPPLSGLQGGAYNITARLDDGTRMTYSSQFT